MSQESQVSVSRRPSRPRRRKVLIAVAATLLVAYFIYTPVMSSLIARALQRAVDGRLHATLQYDSLTYFFPYTVRIKNARLCADESLLGEELLSVKELKLSLAKLPLPHKPVVIRSLEIDSPAVHLVHTADGVVGRRGLLRTDEELHQHPPDRKLSELFELHRFAISDGQIVYDDRTVPDTVPLAFRGINVDLGVMQTSMAEYAYELKSAQPPFAELQAGGTMNIDTLVLDVSKLAMTVESRRVDGESALPPNIQRMVNEFGIAGIFKITGGARLPFRAMNDATAAVDVTIADGKAVLPGDRGRLDRLNVSIHADLQQAATIISLQQFDAQNGNARITVNKASAQVDRDGWRVNHLTGLIDAGSGGPTTQPAVIARLRLLSGTAEFNAQASGHFASPPEYSIAAYPRNVSLILPQFSAPVEHLAGELSFTKGQLTLHNLIGDLLGGRVMLGGTVTVARPPPYDVDLDVQQIDLERLKAMPLFRGRAGSLTGRADARAHLTGVFPRDGSKMIDHLAADGDVAITQGRLWEGQDISAIAAKVGINPESVTVGDAAGLFSIRDRTATLSRAVVNTNMLGLQGKGTVTFDGDLDVDVVAAPLGDWKKQLQKTNIPFVSNMAGAFAGQMQKMVNGASSLLYEFEVKGRIGQPQIRPIPAPALTEGAADVFGKMLQDVKSSDLLKAIK